MQQADKDDDTVKNDLICNESMYYEERSFVEVIYSSPTLGREESLILGVS